jgi:hypothetical protein
MMDPNNKFWVAHIELAEFCDECQSDEKTECDQVDRRCNELERKRTRLTFERLFPFVPCRQCLVRPMCDSECEEIKHFHKELKFVFNELRGHSTYYAKCKSPLIKGPKHLLVKQDSESEELYRSLTDFEFTQSDIANLEAKPYFTDLTDIVCQYCEYREYIKKHQLVNLY